MKKFYLISVPLFVTAFILTLVIGNWIAGIYSVALFAALAALVHLGAAVDNDKTEIEELREAVRAWQLKWDELHMENFYLRQRIVNSQNERQEKVRKVLKAFKFDSVVVYDETVLERLSETLLNIIEALPEPGELEDPELREFYSGVIAEIKEEL